MFGAGGRLGRGCFLGRLSVEPEGVAVSAVLGVFFSLSIVHLSLSCIGGGARESGTGSVFQRWHLEFFLGFLHH